MVPKWRIAFLHVIVAQKTLYFVEKLKHWEKVLVYWPHINLTHNLPKHFIYSRDLGFGIKDQNKNKLIKTMLIRNTIVEDNKIIQVV